MTTGRINQVSLRSERIAHCHALHRGRLPKIALDVQLAQT
jgi:hypothetical protein